MGHISLFERMRIISLFNPLEIGCRNKYKVVSDLAKNNFGIIISAKTVNRWIDRWMKTNNSVDRPRDNKDKLLISNKGMLALNKAI
jgi:hypothetical protein